MNCHSCHKPVEGHPPFCPACGAPLPREAPPDPLVGRTLQGKFKIIKLLGEGGMGAVYVGEQPLGTKTRNVAIKTLHSHLSRDEKIRVRFQREVGTLAGLEHPNTVQVYDFGTTEDGILFIVMEFVQGRSIADILEKEGPIPAARVEKILAQICGSLAEAHAQGIIHRDLKPDNIIITERAGQKDFVKVLDFGIAKRSSETDKNEAKLTQQGMVLGTPPYMSPEQFTGEPLDARSDIYSLGVMAYEMLTGQLPFDAKTAWEWATLHMTAAPKAIEATPNGAALPESMRDAIMRSLAKNREQRFASITDFHARFAGAAPAGPADASRKAATRADAPAPRAATADMPGAPPPPTAAPQGFVGGPPMGSPAPGSVPGVPAAAPVVAAAEAPAKGATMLGEPMAFPPGAFGAGPASPPAYGSPPPATANAPPAAPAVVQAASPYGASAQPYGMQPASVPAHHGGPSDRGGGGGNRGLILGVAGAVAVLSIVAIAWGAGAFGDGRSTPDVPPPDFGGGVTATPTSTPAPATAPPETATPTTPVAPLGNTPPLTPPAPQPAQPGTQPKPKPTTPPPTPTPQPTTPPPAPTPQPTTPPPAPTPQPTTPPPAPTPQPPNNTAERDRACEQARKLLARGSPGAPGAVARCQSLGGTP